MKRKLEGRLVAGVCRANAALERIESLLRDIRNHALKVETPHFAVSQKRAEALTSAAVVREGLARSCRISARTFRRMEAGETWIRSDYSNVVRLTEAAFGAWLRRYVMDEKMRLYRDRSVSYSEAIAEHQGT